MPRWWLTTPSLLSSATLPCRRIFPRRRLPTGRDARLAPDVCRVFRDANAGEVSCRSALFHRQSSAPVRATRKLTRAEALVNRTLKAVCAERTLQNRPRVRVECAALS